jgi:membrane protein
MIIVFIYIVYAAIQLIVSGKDASQLKNAMTNLLYVLVGSALFFGAMWLFGTVLNLNEVRTTAGLRDNLISSNGILFFVLSFLKGAAFFIAIIMIVITGFRMMNPQSGESGDGKKLAKNLVNVIFALVAMKVIDFIYYIASQQNFASQAGNFIIQVAKFLAYVSGSVIVLMIIYSGYLLVVDGGKGENFKKAKNTLINIVFAVAALFFFLFILYQIFSEFN